MNIKSRQNCPIRKCSADKMKKQRILNASEIRTEDVLRGALADSGYRVFARLPLSKVMQREKGQPLSKEDRKFMESSELDFVVANADSIPEFAVEFDGPFHQIDEKQANRDVRKNRLCDLAKLPLWRITDTELEDFDKCTILEFIIMRFLAWRNESDDIKRVIAEYWSTLDTEERHALTDGGIADPTIDPTVHFDIAHPFPRTREVAKRLLEQHGLVSLLAQPFLRHTPLQREYRLFCDVFAPSQERFDDHDLVVRCDYVVSRSKSPFSGIMTIASEVDRKSSEVLMRGALDFRVRASLPVVPDYDDSETPIECFMRNGKMPISFPELPGVTPHDIGETMSEYLGLREIEKWIEENQPE